MGSSERIASAIEIPSLCVKFVAATSEALGAGEVSNDLPSLIKYSPKDLFEK